MRSPRWMVAYAVALALLAGVYLSLVYARPGLALVLGVAAFVATLVSLALVIFR